MATVSPDYQQRGQFNPYYTLKSAVIAGAHTALVKKYKDNLPIFNHYAIEKDIDLIFNSEVSLISGGSIVINPTEALVAIDVNSGKSTLERDIETTAYKTNIEAAKEIAIKSASGKIKPSDIDEQLFNSELLTKGSKDPELLIRTSGEKRISNFLLWQLAYSEIYITDVLWPDFTESEFLKAIIDYQSRNRRFGGIESLSNESFEDSYYSSLSKND